MTIIRAADRLDRSLSASCRCVEVNLENAGNKIDEEVLKLSKDLFASISHIDYEAIVKAAKVVNKASKQCLLGRFVKALSTLDEAQKATPLSTTPAVMRVFIELQRKVSQGALDTLQLKDKPEILNAIECDNDMAFAVRADIKRHSMDLEGAFKDVEMALKLNDENILALEIRADLYRSRGNLVKASEDSQRIVTFEASRKQKHQESEEELKEADEANTPFLEDFPLDLLGKELTPEDIQGLKLPEFSKEASSDIYGGYNSIEEFQEAWRFKPQVLSSTSTSRVSFEGVSQPLSSL